MESFPQSSPSSEDADPHVCVVCGDAATGYRFYGASSVCYSCRIFFRRIVSSDLKFTCNSIEKANNCTINKVTRSHCKKCRYDKCLSVGLLPYLVNSTNRRAKGLKKLEPKKETIFPVSRLENSTSVISSVIKVNPEKPHKLELDDSTFKQFSLQILMQSISDVFYSSFLEQMMEIDGAVISQIRGKRPVITISSDAIDVGYDFLVSSMIMANKTFFPSFSNEALHSLSESTSRTLCGFTMCTMDYFPAENLLEQWKQCSRIFPDKVVSAYKERFPDMESLEPVPSENFDVCMTPYAKCYEDEKFIEATIEKIRTFLCHDAVLCELILLLAVFSPVNVDLSVEELSLVKHYQQKVSIMIYLHLMTRRNLDNFTSLDTMTRIAGCIADLNRMGFIMQHGLLKKSHDENEESINIDSIDIEVLEDEIK